MCLLPHSLTRCAAPCTYQVCCLAGYALCGVCAPLLCGLLPLGSGSAFYAALLLLGGASAASLGGAFSSLAELPRRATLLIEWEGFLGLFHALQ